eukprot:13022521-Heterocapsa_arctica.AAC.1
MDKHKTETVSNLPLPLKYAHVRILFMKVPRIVVCKRSDQSAYARRCKLCLGELRRTFSIRQGYNMI